MEKNYYTVETIEKSDAISSEIDFSLYDEIFPELISKDLELEEWYTMIGWYQNEAHPVNIDKVIDILKGMKGTGCNYVSIDYNVDHIGYELEGLSIRKSKEEEIEKYKSEWKEHKSKEQKIERLQTEIEKLKRGG